MRRNPHGDISGALNGGRSCVRRFYNSGKKRASAASLQQSILPIYHFKVKTLWRIFAKQHTLRQAYNQPDWTGMDNIAELFADELSDIDFAIAQAVQSLPEHLLPLAEHSALRPGKRLRPLLCVAVARCIGLTGNSIYPLAAALEILHCATLIHDDILDQASLRRGQPTVHSRFGTHQAVLAGDVMFALASRLTAAYARPDLVQIFSKAVEQTIAGQALEWSLLYNPACGSTEYERIIGGKTAALFKAAALSGAALAGAAPKIQQEAAGFGKNLGLGFQLRDDALDFIPRPTAGKPQGRDVLDGKLTAPVLAWLDNLPEAERRAFLDKFAARSLQRQDLARLSAAVASPDSGILSSLAAASCWNNAHAHLLRLPNNDFRDKLITIIKHLSRIDVLQHDPSHCL